MAGICMIEAETLRTVRQELLPKEAYVQAANVAFRKHPDALEK